MFWEGTVVPKSTDVGVIQVTNAVPVNSDRTPQLESDLKKITAERDQLATLLLQAFKDMVYLAQTCGSSYSLTALHRMSRELDDMGVLRPEVKL